MAIQRLTAAFRSRSRPSSTPGAKASTVCPTYLDGDHALDPERPNAMVIPVRTALARRCFVGMIVQFSRSAKRRARPDWARGLSKLNSMAKRFAVSLRVFASAHTRAAGNAFRPGPVDIRYRV